MGCSSSLSKPVAKNSDTSSVKERNRQIDQKINKDRLANKKIIKILLLERGDTTWEINCTEDISLDIILHLAGFSKSDLSNYRSVVRQNCITALRVLIEKSKNDNTDFDSAVQKSIDWFIKTACLGQDKMLNMEISGIMLSIWSSAEIQNVFDHHWECLAEHTKHYLDSISRIWATDYLPTEQDILFCRIRTTGICQMDFPHRQLTFKIVDVGGQKNERRKWIHCFDDVQLLMFVAGLADFDRTSSDADSEISRLQENLEIFDSVVNNPIFRYTTVVLFLNKKDIFAEKLGKLVFSHWYSDYKGPNSSEECCEFMEAEFRKKIKSKYQQLFPFRTIATDTHNINSVFEAAIAHVINRNLSNMVRD